VSRPLPGNPKVARPGSAREPYAARQPGGHLASPGPRSTGSGHPQGFPQPVHRWLPHRRSPEGSRRCLGPGSAPPTARGPTGFPTPSPAANATPEPRFPGPRGSSGCPSE